MSFWLQKFGKNLISETEFTVGSETQMIVPLDPISEDQRYSLLNLNQNAAVNVQYKCNELLYSSSRIEGGDLTFKKENLSLDQLWIQNLYTGKNEFKIEFEDTEHNKITVENLKFTALQSLLYDVPKSAKNWSYVKISASYKYSAFNLTTKGNEIPFTVFPQKSQVEESAFYFLVGPRTGTADSFIVKITDEKMVERARDLIRNPQKEKMLFARIQKDHQGFNRNWSKSEKSFWSWSTVEVTNFADLGSTACNGIPQVVEDRMDHWVEDPGQICFWNYRVKKELTALEVSTGL